jgi:IS5 family transposase
VERDCQDEGRRKCIPETILLVKRAQGLLISILQTRRENLGKTKGFDLEHTVHTALSWDLNL